MSTALLTVREVAEYLAVKEAVVRHLLRTRQLEGLKVSGNWRITRAGLQEYVIRQLTHKTRGSS